MGQSEVEGIPIWRSLRLWFALPDYPDKEKRLGCAPGAWCTRSGAGQALEAEATCMNIESIWSIFLSGILECEYR
jgi:hypothetical protein